MVGIFTTSQHELIKFAYREDWQIVPPSLPADTGLLSLSLH